VTAQSISYEKSEEFRRGIFSLRTRRFGTVAEILVAKLINAASPKNIFHDLYDEISSSRVEVKFSTVNEKHKSAISEDNIFEAISEAGKDRALTLAEALVTKFDCNIQQIKTAEFDVLYYGLFFRDQIVMFRIPASDVKSDRKLGYSDKQHKGNVGEGQLHITDRSLPHHLSTYLFRKVSYPEFMEILV
jgi:hypothetical protein